MKIIHTADLHLGQTIYQNYERADEHAHFFAQLEKWCVEEKPDALVVSGDVFDVPQPSAAVKKAFNAHFVRLHARCPEMRIVVTAGNHDSASRLEADRELWELADAHVAGTPPPFADAVEGDAEDWRERFIVRLAKGYVVALPHMNGARTAQIQSILDKIAAENADGKPVVMTAHLALADSDTTGHDQIGGIATVPATVLGEGYDYLALGHIHRPQTLGAKPDVPGESVELPAPVRRYSGSVLHVSCDETFPHSVSLVEIDRHGGAVCVTPLRIDELRHFHVLPESGEAFADAKKAVAAVRRFAEEKKSGYFRLRVRHDADLPADFSQRIYEAIAPFGDEIRFNPKHVVEGAPAPSEAAAEKPVFAVADLQQMADPLEFIEKTIADYPGLEIDEVRGLFEEVREEARRLDDEAAKKAEEAARKKKSAGTAENDDEDADEENA